MTTSSYENEPQETSSLDDALGAFNEALGLIDEKKDPGFYGIVLHDIAEVYIAKGDQEKAAESFRKAVGYKGLADNPGDLATTLLAFGGFLIDCDELTEARTILDQASELLAGEGDDMEPTRRAFRSHALGRAYERLGVRGQDGAYPAALAVYQLTVGLLDKKEDPGSYGTVLADIGDVHRAQGRVAEAVAAYEEAVTYMRGHAAADRRLADLLVFLGRFRRRMANTPVSQTPASDEEDQQPEVVAKDPESRHRAQAPR